MLLYDKRTLKLECSDCEANGWMDITQKSHISCFDLGDPIKSVEVSKGFHINQCDQQVICCHLCGKEVKRFTIGHHLKTPCSIKYTGRIP